MAGSRVEPTCYGKAIDLLSRRGHFQLELRTKLQRRGFDEDDIEATCRRLAAEGLLDDRQAARQFIEERLRRGGIGFRKLSHELQRRGVDSEISRPLLQELLPSNDDEPTRRAASRWLAKQSPERAPDLLAAALARHLERRGFSRRAIFDVLRQVRQHGVETTFETAPYDSDF